MPVVLLCLLPGAAMAQSSFLAPDGRNRMPGVTIFCPSGTGVAPCNFAGSSGGAQSLTLGGSPVSAANRFPVTDSALDALISGGTLAVTLGSGTHTVGAVSQAGTWSVGLSAGSNAIGTVGVTSLPALPAGSNAIGSVSVSNLPATQPISGAVSQAGSWTIGLAAGSSAIGTVGVTSLPALPAGSNAIGSVSVSNLPATQPISGAVSQAGSWTIGLSAGSSAIGTVGVTSLPALPAGSNAIGSVSVSNLPATQAISAAALPLPAGAATSTTNAPVAPATATATNAALLGCQSATTLPSFTAGQQGAVPCDSSGRVYVTTNTNLPTYLQAVSSGGFSYLSGINSAASAMATSVKASAGMLYGYEACNSGSAAIFFRVFSLATAPTVGASTPTLRELVPAGQCARYSTEVGLVFSAGIAFDATAGSLADSDATTIATANTVAVSVFYK